MSDTAPLESRIRTLERRSRLAWGTAGAAVVLALGAGARQPTSVVRAERFELVDGSGDEVGVWSAADATLVLTGPGGEARLAADRTGPSLTLEPRRGDTVMLDAGRRAAPAPAAAAQAPEPDPVPAEAPSTAVTVRLDETLVGEFSAVEMVCPASQFRERAVFTAGTAQFPWAPEDDVDCDLFFKGGAPAVARRVSAGVDLLCTMQGAALSCSGRR